MEIEIYITLKKTISDPQGLTIKNALQSLGYHNLEEVRIGKLITLRLNSESKEEAEKIVNEMCRKLLANPIIEDYRFKIKSQE